jgi:alkylhydroperoxidase family enzyme
VDAVCRDAATAPIPPREKALFAYLGKLIDAPGQVTRADALALSAAGWSDAEAFDAVTVCALFSFFNRWIDGNGVPDVPKGFYEARLEKHGDMGYAPSS